MKERRVVMLIRSGVGFLTNGEKEAYQDFVDMDAEGTENEPIACGAPLNGPAIPIPGINQDGNMVSVIETDWTPEQITQRLSEVDDYLPTLAIDITDQIENGTLSINAQMATTSLGAMFEGVFDIVPTGEFDKEAEEERAKKSKDKLKEKLESLKAKINNKGKSKGHVKSEDDEDDCDCPACELRRELTDKLGKSPDVHEFDGGVGIGIDIDADDLDPLDRIKEIIGKLLEKRGLGDALKESMGSKKKPIKKYKRKTSQLDMDQLLDIIKERGGVDKLDDGQLKRLDELSKNLD